MREMKDSGIPYVGKIPKEWCVDKVKHIVTIPVSTGAGEEAQFYTPNSIRYIRISDFNKNGCIIEENARYIPADKAEKYILSSGDILAATAGATVGKTLLFEGLNEVACYAGFLARIRTDENKMINRFLMYQMKCMIMDGFRSYYVKKSTIENISASAYSNMPVVLAPIDRQHKIVDYLDVKCSMVDSIIAKQKAIIEKLKEYKLSLITEAVTKGLNPGVEMKDSGIEYIGLIPKSWKQCRLRNIGTPQNGISKGGDSFGHGTPFVSYGDVYKNYSLPETVSGLVDASVEEQANYSVEKGDIFFTRTSETIEEVGFSCVCEKTIPKATFAGFIIRVRPFNDSMKTRFAKYYFRSVHHRQYLSKKMNLVTRASLGQDLLKSMPVLLPPIDEQEVIADYLDKKCETIDKLILEKQSLIEKYKEYKKSLIYEVVTGKKEV